MPQYGQYVDSRPSFYQPRNRVADEGFGSINFGAQNKYGDDSLNDWRQQAAEQEERNNPRGGGFMDSLRSAYGKTPALDEYRSFLQNSPNSEDYKPNWMTRIAAGLSGAAAGFRNPGEGVKVAQDINRSKYDYALKDYYSKAAPLKEAAGIEREGMQDRVKALLEGRKTQMDYLDYERNMTKDERDYLIATGKLKVDQAGQNLNERKFGYDRTKGDRDYNLDVYEADSLNKYRRGQLGIAGYGAQTDRMDTESLIGRRADQTFFDNMGLGKGDTVSAGDVGRAEKDALGSMANDYPVGTIVYEPDANQWQIGRNVDPNTRATIAAEVEKRVGARTRGGLSGGGGGITNFGGTYNPNPPDLPNFGPSQNNRRGGSRYGGGRQ